jgi:Calcineurin-like phosphoesterase
VRTVVISDLHLGSRRQVEVARRPGPLAALAQFLAGADRLVLLGDLFELRHGPWRQALEAGRPVLETLGAALGADGEIVVVSGNHDHALVAPWLEARAQRQVAPPLGLETRAPADATPASVLVAEWVAPARLSIAHPGVWLREDVYATHGHYLDRVITVPTFERLAAGAMGRVVGRLPAPRATAEDFEAALAPVYAWLHALANGPASGGWAAGRQASSASTWELLAGNGHRPLRGRALAKLLPLAILALNRGGIGPLRPDISGAELRRAGLRAIGDVCTRLGVEAAHVVFGHTHRAGPLERDDVTEWTGPGGVRLHNCGCWVEEPVFARGDHRSPYWAGRAIELEDTDPPAPPRLVRVVDDLR